METQINKRAIFNYLRDNFELDWKGIHGAGHWSRVLKNGLLIARSEGAREDVVWLFSFLHDHKRTHEGEDFEHGLLAKENAIWLRRHGGYFRIDDAGFDELCYAMSYHSDGLTQSSLTIRTCWDADRLDLGRVGIIPDPQFLCTKTAKDPDFLSAAYHRSIK